MQRVQREGEWYALMRCETVHLIKDFDSLLEAAVSGMHGRSFINDAWAQLLRNNHYNLPT